MAGREIEEQAEIIPHSLAYRLGGAALGGAIGVLIDIVQRQELSAAVKLSKIFAMHLQLPAPPVVFLILIFLLGILFALFFEKHSGHRTLFIAAGFTALLQSGVPGGIPTTTFVTGGGITSSTLDPTGEFSVTARLVSGPARARVLGVVTADGNPIGKITMRFDQWDWRRDRWTSQFAKFNEESNRLKVRLDRLLQRKGVYYITTEVEGYRITTKKFMFGSGKYDDFRLGFVRIVLEPSRIPLSIQRLFIVPPTERPMPREVAPV